MPRLNLVPASASSTRGMSVTPGRPEFTLGGVEHRLEVPEVRRGDHHFGGDHDLMLVGDALGVVALQKPAAA